MTIPNTRSLDPGTYHYYQGKSLKITSNMFFCRVLKGDCSRGGGVPGNPRLGNLRGITTPPKESYYFASNLIPQKTTVTKPFINPYVFFHFALEANPDSVPWIPLPQQPGNPAGEGRIPAIILASSLRIPFLVWCL